MLRRRLVPQVQFSRGYAQMLVAVLGTTICQAPFFWQSAAVAVVSLVL